MAYSITVFTVRATGSSAKTPIFLLLTDCTSKYVNSAESIKCITYSLKILILIISCWKWLKISHISSHIHMPVDVNSKTGAM